MRTSKSPEKIAAQRFSSEIAACWNKEELFNESSMRASSRPGSFQFRDHSDIDWLPSRPTQRSLRP